ncbi:MAG TPA: DNA polymerase III subunit gamma/tau [Gemmatimonadaceae bacterium]|nr:DNA polymerase III subunit gamma/tau [Gemmatimonadaceae bacterium]
MSLALARKYRPKRFADVAVQSHVSTTLKGAIARGRVAHGYLLCGPRGVGKTTLARVLAMALNCERRGEPELDGEPCGECASCRRIWSGSASLDVVEIDAASNRGVDDARELRERAMYAPSGEDHHKVYIVDEAHMLTREAWNALLKILEEPPPRVVFVFATTEPQKIAQSAAPVLSRLQRFDFKRIGPAEIRQRLTHVLTEEKITAEPEALAAIARAADGSMRDALSLTDQVLSMGDGRVTAERVRDALGLVPEDEFIAILDLIADRRAADVFPAVGRLAEAGIDFGSFLNGLADILRAQLTVVLGGTASDVSERAREALESRRERFVAADLLRMLQALGELEPRFRKSGQQQLLIETLLVRFALLDQSIALEDMLRAFGGSGSGSPSPSPSAPRREPSSGGGTGGPGGFSASAAGNSGASPKSDTRSAPRAESSASTVSSVSSVSSVTSGSRPAVAARPTPSAATQLAPQAQPRVLTDVAVDVLDLAKLTGRWDVLVERLRSGGKPMLATALEHSSPLAVTAGGVVTIELDEPNDIYAHAISTGRTEIVALLGEWFVGVSRVDLKRDEQTPVAAPKRLTEEMVRADRIASLRKRDPVLNAAIDALDLDVVD